MARKQGRGVRAEILTGRLQHPGQGIGADADLSLDLASNSPGIGRPPAQRPRWPLSTTTGARHANRTRNMEKQDRFDDQTRFALVGGALASLIILAVCMAFITGA